MSVMLISIMFVNMTSAAQIKDIKGTRVERQYSNHYSAQFNELWDSFGRSEISIYDINYNINDTYNPTTFNDTNGRDSAGYEILLKVDGKEVWLGNSHYKITKNMTVYIMVIQGLNWITSGLMIIMKMQPETNLPR